MIYGVRRDGVTLLDAEQVAVPATSFRSIAVVQGDAIVSEVHEAG